MANLNMDRILNGNPNKRFIIAFENMRKDYNEDTAHALYDIYSSESLGFVMEHLDEIVKESYYGVPFLENLVKTQETVFPAYNNM